MRFNGIDPCTLHRGISIKKEIPPGMPRREVITVRGAGAETLGGVEEERSEYIVQINIAGRSKAEAMEMRAKLAKWARSSGEETALLEPTHWRGKAYNAIVASIEDPEFVFGFATIEIVFIIPDGVAHETTLRSASGTGTMSMIIGGSEPCWPIIQQTIKEARNGLIWKMDGTVFLNLKGSLTAGQVVEMDFEAGSLTIDGDHAENRINFVGTFWDPPFSPGYRSITSEDGGVMTARWHDVWA